MPDKIAADHKQLDALLDTFDAGLRKLLSPEMAQATLQRALLPRVQVRTATAATAAQRAGLCRFPSVRRPHSCP